MCANWYLSWLLTCIGDTPYVCLHFILLSSPTAADVTKIAHRERVSNGTLPKLGRVLTPLWGKATPLSKKRRLRWRCASLFHQLLCHHENLLLPWVVLVWQTLYRRELLAKQDLYSRYYWTRLLIKISSFTGCKSFLKSLCAWTHILFPSPRAWSHLRCTPMELLPASHYMFVDGVRAWTYMEQWSTLHRSQSLCVTNFVRKRSLAKFIIFYIWCCYSIVAYIHLRLRLHLQHLHPSVYNYIDYSSAVGLDSIALRAMPDLL